jgi:bacterioferritin-associated ferredoxin
VYVCHCKAVTDQAIDEAITSGARSVDDLAVRCRAGSGCGGCHSTLQALIDSIAVELRLADASVA